MKPKKKDAPQKELFQHELVELVDPRHALVKLAYLIDWGPLEKEFSAPFHDSFGRPAKSVRLMTGLLLLQHTFNLSDEEVVARFVENPYYQYFCGNIFFEHTFPCDPTSLTRWRKRLGRQGCEKILQLTIDAGLKSKTIKKSDFHRVIVDTTVQEKNIAHPTDSKLYAKALLEMVRMAKQAGITLRQTYTRTAKQLTWMIGRYAHAKQFKRMKRSLKSLKTLMGRVWRDLGRKVGPETDGVVKIKDFLANVSRLIIPPKGQKLYSLHAPDVLCFNKGKARRPYEFGSKVSVAITHRTGFVVGCKSLRNNPYDAHSLQEALDQVEHLTRHTVDQVFVDKGYRGHGVSSKAVFISGQRRGITPTLKKHLKRRQAIEPIIGHMKNDGKLGRNYLKGLLGNTINALLSGAGQNMRSLLNALYLLLLFLWRWAGAKNPLRPTRLHQTKT